MILLKKLPGSLVLVFNFQEPKEVSCIARVLSQAGWAKVDEAGVIQVPENVNEGNLMVGAEFVAVWDPRLEKVKQWQAAQDAAAPKDPFAEILRRMRNPTATMAGGEDPQ